VFLVLAWHGLVIGDPGVFAIVKALIFESTCAAVGHPLDDGLGVLVVGKRIEWEIRDLHVTLPSRHSKFNLVPGVIGAIE
jgi:hypothetical protein